MSHKKQKAYYNTPLNVSQTIDLPSNLLRANPTRNSFHPIIPVTPNSEEVSQLNTPRESILPIEAKKSENVMLIEEKNRARRNVLYKRLTDIKSQNEQLQRYSYSKLLSKMVVVDPRDKYRSMQVSEDNTRTISQYSCLRGKLLHMQCQNDGQKNRQPSASGNSDYSNRTTRIFKRYYMGSSDKASSIASQQPVEQKYIYINGKKTECKRIHNFYTSQNFRNSYDKAFGRTKDSFYSRKERYQNDF